MSIKKWVVNFKLPQLSASHYYHSVMVDAPDVGLAIRRAWQEIKKRPAVKGKRIKEATVTIGLE